MEHLSISLWFTLIIWGIFVLAAILFKLTKGEKEIWIVNANILIYTIGLPAIAILLEYLLVR
jgi:uncharacterized protein (DUF983 family)